MNRFMGYSPQLRVAQKLPPIVREVVKGPDIDKIREFQAKSQRLQAEMQKADNLGRAQVYMNNSIKPKLNLKLPTNNVYTPAAQQYAKTQNISPVSSVSNPIKNPEPKERNFFRELV